jgi:hypothetical protein
MNASPSLVTKYCSEPIPLIQNHLLKRKRQWYRVIPPVAEGMPNRVEILFFSKDGDVENSTVMDQDDWDKVKKYSIRSNCANEVKKNKSNQRHIYAKLFIEKKKVSSKPCRYQSVEWMLHKFILGIEYGRTSMVVDHINGDTLDNTRVNLRAVSVSVNSRNRHVTRCNTGVLGVCLKTTQSGYTAQIHTTVRKRIKKFFSFGKRSLLTKEEAFVKACDWRRQKELEYGYLSNADDRTKAQTVPSAQ